MHHGGKLHFLNMKSDIESSDEPVVTVLKPDPVTLDERLDEVEQVWLGRGMRPEITNRTKTAIMLSSRTHIDPLYELMLNNRFAPLMADHIGLIDWGKGLEIDADVNEVTEEEIQVMKPNKRSGNTRAQKPEQESSHRRDPILKGPYQMVKEGEYTKDL
jgi:hypothetical protein